MSKKNIINILFFVFAIFLAASTMFKSVEVFSHSDLNAISCGWPLNFIVQDQGWRDPPYPWKVPCLASPLESSTKFNWQYFILDTVFFYLILLAIYYGKNLIIKKKQRIVPIYIGNQKREPIRGPLFFLSFRSLELLSCFAQQSTLC